MKRFGISLAVVGSGLTIAMPVLHFLALRYNVHLTWRGLLGSVFVAAAGLALTSLGLILADARPSPPARPARPTSDCDATRSRV
jgi:hypothetical protein